MSMRERYVEEINKACDELKNAGIPHATDLAKHIVRMKKELKFYDKCHNLAKGGKKAANNGGEVSAKREPVKEPEAV